jgi:hypothetical protein
LARTSKRAASQIAADGPRSPRRRATTIATDGRLVLVGGPATSRLFVYLAGNFLHRIERERRELYYGDLDLALLAEVIGTAGVAPGMRDTAYRQKHRNFDTVVSVQDQRAVNATSIATAVGRARPCGAFDALLLSAPSQPKIPDPPCQNLRNRPSGGYAAPRGAAAAP